MILALLAPCSTIWATGKLTDTDNNKNVFVNVSWVVNQHIRMISEGSCDTEDWSNNDAENSALITDNYILKYILIENS